MGSEMCIRDSNNAGPSLRSFSPSPSSPQTRVVLVRSFFLSVVNRSASTFRYSERIANPENQWHGPTTPNYSLASTLDHRHRQLRPQQRLPAQHRSPLQLRLLPPRYHHQHRRPSTRQRLRQPRLWMSRQRPQPRRPLKTASSPNAQSGRDVAANLYRLSPSVLRRLPRAFGLEHACPPLAESTRPYRSPCPSGSHVQR